MKHMPALLALTALVSVPCAVSAQTLSPEMITKVDKIFDKYDRTDSPGCALGVYQDGKIVYAHGYGMANLNDDVTITPETVFHVASMSKQFTAASILLLAAQGKLSLDDDVHKYIPELQDYGVPVTLRQMMHHTSGLRDQWALLELAGWRYSQDLITDADVLSVVERQKELNFKPGEKFMYSNTGFTLLAIIVSRVSGMSFREFTSKNIFDPLGMTHTHFRDDHEEVIKHDALGYEQAGNTYRMNLTNFDTAGATSLHTTVEDLQLWDENFYHPRVGGQALIDEMLKRGVLNSGELQDYAGGLSIGTYKGLKTVDHSGGDAGYRSDMTRFPDQHFSASVLCNLAETDPAALVRQVADVVLAADILRAKDLKEPAPVAEEKQLVKAVPVPPMMVAQMSAITGSYWNGEDEFAKVVVKDGKLLLDVNRDDWHELLPFAPNHFHVADESWGERIDLHFVAADGTKPRYLEESFGGGKPRVFDLVTLAPLTAAELADYAGDYVSAEIDPVYRMVVKDGQVVLHRLKHYPDALRPAIHDVFVGDIGKIRFTRDAAGHVNGLILDADRISNFKFTKKTD